MSAYTDKVRPRTLRSGLLALGSGGQSFEEGSHLCFMYLKKKKKKRIIEQYHKLLLVSGGGLVLTQATVKDGRYCSSNRAVWPWCSVRPLKI